MFLCVLWCSGHCKQLASKWRKLAESLHGVVRVAAVNCDEQKALCQAQGVRGYPTIKAFKEGRFMEYNGGRSASSLQDWGLSLLSSNLVSVVTSEKSMEQFMKSSAKARWGLGVLLFSSKDKTSALYKSLSMRYKNKISFGEVRVSSPEGQKIAERLKVSKFPSLLAVCSGDERSIVVFEKEMKNSQLVRWLNAFYSGKICAEAVKIDSSTDLSAMRVGQLKQLLSNKNASCKECVEKADFIKKVKEIYQI